jgi:hypothetical protein
VLPPPLASRSVRVKVLLGLGALGLIVWAIYQAVMIRGDM